MKCVTYARVSTARQGQSGLGLEAQQAAITSYLHGAVPLAEYVEVESGTHSDRPELAKALAMCRKHKAVLVIAKLDRLARNVAFISNLMESGVEFTACDFPQANRLTLHILAAVAEHEARMISERTKAALAAAKARGRTLGNPNLGTQSDHNAAKANEFTVKLRPTLMSYKARGMSLDQMVHALTAAKVPTQNEGQWSERQLRRMFKRLEAACVPLSVILWTN